jgi:23S rRNA (adenine2503-C2)-methyltransferase
VAPVAPPPPRPSDSRLPLAGLAFEEIEAVLRDDGLAPSHAARLARHLLRGTATDLASVPGLGPRPAARLASRVAPRVTRVVSRAASPDGTEKLLVEAPDGERVEAVLMRLARRTSACVSTQVGCGAACAFCASGLQGLRRSLEAHEIVEQFLHLAAEARRAGGRLSNLVYMGMGEPLHAYDAVVRSIRLLTDPRLVGFGSSHVTVSTVGIVPGIRALAEEGLGVNLAVSVHAADDALRRALLPVGGRHSVAETLDAAEAFRARTRRFVTLQVTLMDDVNDRVEHAEALADAIDGRRFHVNLILFNPVPGTPFRASSQERVDAFAAALRRRGVVAHVRARRGVEVDAACGQLRRRAGAPIVRPAPGTT